MLKHNNTSLVFTDIHPIKRLMADFENRLLLPQTKPHSISSLVYKYVVKSDGKNTSIVISMLDEDPGNVLDRDDYFEGAAHVLGD